MADKIRILISAEENRELYIAVTERLMRATREHPENWETVIGRPGVVDHVGHHTDTFSRVVWFRQYDGGPLFRLTIRDDHPVYDDLRALIITELAVTEQSPETAEQIAERVIDPASDVDDTELVRVADVRAMIAEAVRIARGEES